MARKFVTLTYHRVTEKADPMRPGQCHAALFANQLAVLTRFFNVLSLEEAVERSLANDLPSRCVCVSFDDGYLDNHDVALPLLKTAGVPATFFVASGFLGDGLMWNDRIIEALRARDSGRWDLADYGLDVRQIDSVASRLDAVNDLIGTLRYRPPAERDKATLELLAQAGVTQPPRLMMAQDHVRALAQAGMTIGGHTVNHPILSRLDDAVAGREIADGRAALGRITDAPVSLFAYPNGKPGRDYDERHAALAREAGFEAAFSTAWGYASPASERFELPRVGLELETGWRFALKLGRVFFEREIRD